MLEHDTGAHVENGDRMTATMALLEDAGLLPRMQRLTGRTASDDELALVHDQRYVAAVRDAANAGGGWVDPDTLITPRSFDVAAAVVGATLNAVDAVVRGEAPSAYVLARPPGHHAMPAGAMGFCLLNHVAVAARYARERLVLRRVAIVDYDVHHGNGTQDAFWDDGSVLYVSTHEYPFYPGTGDAGEVGEGDGRGATINIPMPHGAGDEEHLRAFEEIVAPALRRFAPELILVSAGFDAHFADEIALQRLSVDGYGALTSLILREATALCDGRVVFAQEGGYHLSALPWCVRRTLELMLGLPPSPDPLGVAPGAPIAGFDSVIAEVRRMHAL